MWMADPSDDLTDAIEALQALTRVRQALERGSLAYEAAVMQETKQIQIVRELAVPTFTVKGD